MNDSNQASKKTSSKAAILLVVGGILVAVIGNVLTRIYGELSVVAFLVRSCGYLLAVAGFVTFLIGSMFRRNKAKAVQALAEATTASRAPKANEAPFRPTPFTDPCLRCLGR